jgi:spermidine synthase
LSHIAQPVTAKTKHSDFAWAVLLCFLLSGMSGLIYQVIWVRQLELVFGTTTFAASTVLTAFMGGLAGGSYYFGRRAHKTGNPLKLYGMLELGIGAYGLAIPHLFTGLPAIYEPLYPMLHTSFVLLTVVRLILTLAVLIVPTALMGATLPVLAAFYAPRGRSIGLNVGRLYSINTFGAVIGACGGGFVLIPALGMRLTSYTAAAINISLGLVALALSRRLGQASEWAAPETDDLPEGTNPLPSEDGVQAKSATATKRRWPGANLLARLRGRIKSRGSEAIGAKGQIVLGKAGLAAVLAAFSLSGFVALSYEVIWSRVLALIIGSSVYAFSIMLATFLIGLALGSAISARIVDRMRRPVFNFGLIELGIGASTMAGAWLFNELPYVFLSLYRAMAGSNIAVLLLARFIVSSAVMIVPTLLLGFLFPLVIRIVHGRMEGDPEPGSPSGATLSRTVGDVYAINTLGSIAGAFASGFILIPWLGMLGSMRLCAITNLIIAMGLFFTASRLGAPAILGARADNRRARRDQSQGSRPNPGPVAPRAGIALALVVAAAVLVVAPPWDISVMSSAVYRYAPQVDKMDRKEFFDFFSDARQGDAIYYKEGLTATVVVQRQNGGLVLKVNGKPDASTGGDLPTQVLIGALPLLARDKTKNCLVIGLGSGITLGTVEQFPVSQVTCVELEPAVIQASHCFDHLNNKPLDDPRLNLISDDGRNFVETTREKFDVIVSEPSNPWLTGAASLFTREYFRRGAEKLTDGGIFSQWLQIYEMAPEDVRSLVATFRDAFPHSYLFRGAQGDLMLLGSRKELRLDLDVIRAHMADPKVATELERIKVTTPAELVSRFYMGPDELLRMTAGSQMNTDDNALIEFNAPRRVGTTEETVNRNVNELLGYTASPLPYIDGRFQSDVPLRTLALVDIAEGHGPPDFLLDAALAAIKRDDLGRADQFVSYSLALSETARGHSIEGEILAARGDDNQALDQWHDALALDPSHLYTLLDFGKYYLKKQDAATAAPFLDRALQTDPTSARAHHLRGLAYQAVGDAEHAVEHYRQALPEAKYTRSIPSFYLNFGTALVSLGQYNEAAEMLEEYEKLQPDDVDAHYQIGAVYEMLDERSPDKPYTDRIIDELKRTIEMRPDYAMAHYYLSKAYRRQGMDDQAEAEFELYEKFLPR